MEAARDGVLSARKKYLVDHDSSRATTIFDYIHLSSKLLRKVRHGQPLEIAVNPRATKNKRSPPRDDPATSSNSASASRPNLFRSPSRSRESRDKILSQSKSNSIFPAESPRRSPATTFLRFGRTVRFVADDGGLLLVDNDGSLKKAPAMFSSDTRTLLTVFPSNPLAVGATSKCVRAGEGVFLAQGIASVYGEHGVVHAEARRMRDLSSSGDSCKELRPTLHIRWHGDDDRSAQEEITVWTLSKFVDTNSLMPGRPSDSKMALRSLDEEYFPNGASLEIRQGGRVVCYEPVKPETARGAMIPSVSVSPTRVHGDSPLSDASSPDHESAESPAAFTTDLWLDEVCSAEIRGRRTIEGGEITVATRWKLVDVADEKQRQQRRRYLLAICKPNLDRRLGASNPNRVGSADPTFVSTRSHGGTVSPANSIEQHQEETADLEERLNRAARIIVRFLRRICIDEAAKKRISDLAQRKRRGMHRQRISRTESHINQQLGPTAGEQWRILHCYKPSVYASHPLLVPPLNATPQKVAAMRQRQRNRERSRQEKPARISHELAFLRGAHATTVLLARPATTK